MAEAVRVVLLHHGLLQPSGGYYPNLLLEFIDYCVLYTKVKVFKVLMEHPTVREDQRLKNKLLAKVVVGTDRFEFVQ